MIVDGPYLAHRSHCAPYRLVTTTGLDATMVHSFLRTMNSLRKKFEPRKIIVAWESHGTQSWRKKEYSNYKCKTKGKTKLFWRGIKTVQLCLYLLGVEQYYSPENEADDVIANIVKHHKNSDIVIFTMDKDIMQLVTDRCYVYTGKDIFKVKDVERKYCVLPRQIPDLLAIWGDKADNIDGINGYGLKKSAKILEKHGSIEGIPESATIYKYINRMQLNKRLATLNTSCGLYPVPNDSFKTSETFEGIIDTYELNSIKKDIDEYKKLGSRGEIDKWI